MRDSHAKKKVCVPSQLTLLCSSITLGLPLARFKRTLAVLPGDCTARTFAKASAIYNERRFSATMLERARLKSVWERNHGRFE